MLNLLDLQIGDKIREIESFLGIQKRGVVIQIESDRVEYEITIKKHQQPPFSWGNKGFVFQSDFQYWEKY